MLACREGELVGHADGTDSIRLTLLNSIRCTENAEVCAKFFGGPGGFQTLSTEVCTRSCFFTFVGDLARKTLPRMLLGILLQMTGGGETAERQIWGRVGGVLASDECVRAGVA